MNEWAEAKARAKAEINRIAADVSKRANAEAEVKLRERDDAANTKIEEAGARIRAREETKTAKR